MSLSIKLVESLSLPPLLAFADGYPGAHMTTVESLTSGTRLLTGLGTSRGALSPTAIPSPELGHHAVGRRAPLPVPLPPPPQLSPWRTELH